MANEVVNPFQLYRDEKGRPLAGGSLRILVPGTSSLGTAFSDSDLTVPQIVDGYPLDAYGRVTGDLRWPGLRDVQVYDATGAFIRTDSDNVTLIDSSDFAINVATVADMIAEQTLVVGDVVETENYLAGTQRGGARYLIVAAMTGTDDGYRFHDLSNGLQAQLLDQEANNNPFVAGAVGDGAVDDSQPVQRLLNIGGDIDLANGTFAVQSLTLALDARIHGDGTLLRFVASDAVIMTLSGTDLTVTFDGITLDGNLANQTAQQAIAMISSTIAASGADEFSFITFNNVTFKDGSQYDVFADGADDGFPVLYSFAQCTFTGGEEGADAFLVASILIQDGVNVAIEDCYWNLAATATTGRPAVVVQNSGTELTNPGSVSISASTMIGMGMENTTEALSRGAIDIRDAANVIISANRILTPQAGGIVWDAGVDAVTVTENLVDALASSSIALGSIHARGSALGAADNWQIDANTITGGAARAIRLDGNTAGADVSQVQIRGNVIDAPTLEAILLANLDTVAIQNNQINMANVATIPAITHNGVLDGQISIEGNEIQNVDGYAISFTAFSSPAAVFTVDGNTIDSAENGITIVDALAAFITNNMLSEINTRVVEVGTLTDCVVDGNQYNGAQPTGYLNNLGSITQLLVGENMWQQVATSVRNIAVSGANQTVGPVVAHQHEFIVTGVSSIDTLQDPGVDGWVVVCQSDAGAALTFNDGLGNMNLGANRTLSDQTDTLTLMWNQTNSEWNQLAFSDN